MKEFHCRHQEYFSRLMIFSLAKRWDKGLMWPHYAQSHQGFCIGFSKSGLASQYPNPLNIAPNVNLDPIVPVIYSETRVLVPLAKNIEISSDLFYTKSSDWEYEQEWRLFTQLGDRVNGEWERMEDSKGMVMSLSGSS
jgi:hypothetical protein